VVDDQQQQRKELAMTRIHWPMAIGRTTVHDVARAQITRLPDFPRDAVEPEAIEAWEETFGTMAEQMRSDVGEEAEQAERRRIMQRDRSAIVQAAEALVTRPRDAAAWSTAANMLRGVAKIEPPESELPPMPITLEEADLVRWAGRFHGRLRAGGRCLADLDEWLRVEAGNLRRWAALLTARPVRFDSQAGFLAGSVKTSSPQCVAQAASRLLGAYGLVVELLMRRLCGDESGRPMTKLSRHLAIASIGDGERAVLRRLYDRRDAEMALPVSVSGADRVHALRLGRAGFAKECDAGWKITGEGRRFLEESEVEPVRIVESDVAVLRLIIGQGHGRPASWCWVSPEIAEHVLRLVDAGYAERGAYGARATSAGIAFITRLDAEEWGGS
jgi:hypothetical protein